MEERVPSVRMIPVVFPVPSCITGIRLTCVSGCVIRSSTCWYHMTVPPEPVSHVMVLAFLAGNSMLVHEST